MLRAFQIILLLAGITGPAPAAPAAAAPEANTSRLPARVSEWPVPTPKFARDPAVAPDGSIYFAARAGDKIARFDPKRKLFKEWSVPAGTGPQGVAVAQDGNVIFGGTEVHELDPASGAVKQYKCPSSDSKPYSVIVAPNGWVWFTQRGIGKVAKLERSSGKITEYHVGEDPYALALDRSGNVWITRKAADRITKLDPITGATTELALAIGSQPRRIAVAPDGMVWVTLYGSGKLLKVDPAAFAVTQEYQLPGGPNAGPYTVNADGAGRIWVSEIQTDSLITLNPRTGSMSVLKLPTRDAGVRSAVIDAAGRYWYIGSLSGRLGVVD